MELQVTIKNHYGKDFIYPYCNKAEVFTLLTGRKTLSNKDMFLIKQLGYSLKVVIERTL